MEEDLCMGIALMDLTFPVTCSGQYALQLGLSAHWNLKHNGMQAIYIRLVSGTSMIVQPTS